jgi:two-component system, OmpR family, sensor histidine kinase SenX3
VPSLMDELYTRWRDAAPRTWLMGPVTDDAVTVDRDRLTVAMDALLENAVRHTCEDEEIEISATRRDGMVAFSVRDGGEGIPADLVDHIFNRFYRVDPGRNRKLGGAGLGLSIVRAIAEGHGGGVSVASQPGQGATFRLEIPLSRPPSSTGEQPVSTPADRLDTNRRLQLPP